MAISIETDEKSVNIKEICNKIAEILKENIKYVKWEDIEKNREDKNREW